MDINLMLELEEHGYIDCDFSYKAVQAVLMDEDGDLAVVVFDQINHKWNVAKFEGVSLDKFREWKAGALIQNVFPDMEMADRECLIIGMNVEDQAEMYATFIDEGEPH